MRNLITLLIIFKFFSSAAQDLNQSIADSLFITGNYSKAINAYSKLGSEKSSLQIARAYAVIGNYPKAIVQYNNLIKKSPQNQIARFELGKLYLKLKKLEESKSIFEMLVIDGASNPEYHYYYGEAFRRLKEADSSVVAYKSAVAIDSTHLRSLFQLGKYYVTQREKSNALLYIDKGLRYYEEDVSLINLKALVLYNNMEFEEAIPWFERVLELGEKKPYLYNKLGYSYFKNWEFNKAKQMLKTSIGINDEDPEVYLNLASVYSKNKEKDSAVFYIKESIKIQQPSLGKEYNFLATIFREKNNLKLALKYYNLASAESPKNPTYYYQVCTIADQYYQDSSLRLEYYEHFIERFGRELPYFSDIVTKRISQLKEEIHYSKK